MAVAECPLRNDEFAVVLVREHTWQNQRFLFKWREPSLPFDRYAWSTEDGKVQRTRESVRLPEPEDVSKGIGVWCWAGDWRVDIHSETDENGWQHALDFPGQYHAENLKFDVVRRRKWIRPRVARIPNDIYWHTFIEEKEEAPEPLADFNSSRSSSNASSRSLTASVDKDQSDYRIEVLDTYENEEKINNVWVPPSFNRYHWSNVDGTVERPKELISLPDETCEWMGGWTFEVGEHTDAQGWQYPFGSSGDVRVRRWNRRFKRIIPPQSFVQMIPGGDIVASHLGKGVQMIPGGSLVKEAVGTVVGGVFQTIMVPVKYAKIVRAVYKGETMHSADKPLAPFEVRAEMRQSLANGLDQLEHFVENKHFGKAQEKFRLCFILLDFFHQQPGGPEEISRMEHHVRQLTDSVQERMREDFASSQLISLQPNDQIHLREGCDLLEFLSERTKIIFLQWYCKLFLEAYGRLFGGGKDAGSLDNIHRRFAWINRSLNEFDFQFSAVFPQHWNIQHRILLAFGNLTFEHLMEIFKRTKDPSVVTKAVEVCREFEDKMKEKYLIRDPELRKDLTLTLSNQLETFFQFDVTTELSAFQKIINKAKSREKYSDLKSDLDNELEPKMMYLNSATQMFDYIHQSIRKCAQINTKNLLVHLTRSYSEQQGSYKNYLKEKIRDFPHHSSCFQHNPISRYLVIDIRYLCVIANTCQYCIDQCIKLGEDVEKLVGSLLSSQLEQEHEYSAYINEVIDMLTQLFSLCLIRSWDMMKQTEWHLIVSPGDQSTYSLRICQVLEHVRHIGTHSSQDFYGKFLHHFIQRFSRDYVAAIYSSGQISCAGAEQMLVDMHTVKKKISNITATTLSENRQEDVRLAELFVKPLSLLQVLSTEASNTAELRELCGMLLPDLSESEFDQLLELHGIKFEKTPKSDSDIASDDDTSDDVEKMLKFYNVG